MLTPFVSTLFFLVIVGGAVLIAIAASRRGEPESDPGIGTLRRVFNYTLSFFSLAAGGAGLTLLIRFVLDALFASDAISTDTETVALGMALTVVGGGIWLAFQWLTGRALREYPVETRALARKLYVYLVLGGAALAAATGAARLLQWAFRVEDDDFSGTAPALLLVWGGVWAYHWLQEDREDSLTALTRLVRQLYTYLISLFGLVLLATGVFGVLDAALSEAYFSASGGELLHGGRALITGEAARLSLSLALVGGALWWWHWARIARDDARSGLRSVYLYLFTILGGAGTVVISATVLLFHVLEWVFGGASTDSAVEQFDIVPGLLAAGIVGAGLWGYHRAVAEQEEAPSGQGVGATRRVYSYLVAAVGLLTLGIGLSWLFATFLGLIDPGEGESITGGAWRDPLALALTLIIVGSPLWAFFWRGAQRMVAEGPAEEREALSRRVFMYGTFGISIVVALINLSIILFNLFQAALGETEAADLLGEIRWSLAILLAAGAISGYYWQVLSEDRRAVATAGGVQDAVRPPARKRVTIVAPQNRTSAARRLEDALGYPVEVWRRADDAGAPELSEEEAARAAQGVHEAASNRVLLLLDSGGIRVIPYST